LKRKYKRYKTDAVKNELAAAERQYKRTLDISMSRHRKDMQNKLKTMRTKNPKEFWKILNKGTFSSETTGPIATKWPLDGPLPKLCPVIPASKMAAKLKKKGNEILIVHCFFSVSQNELQLLLQLHGKE
jgi:hypothetical protein